MDRFDRRFNELDPATGRPFSAGHPDGVWMICIIYSMLLIVSVVPGIMALVNASAAEPAGVSAFIPFVAACAMFVPPMVFFVQRRKIAVVLMFAVFLLMLMGALVAGSRLHAEQQLNFIAVLGMTGVVAAQGCAALYARSLKRDGLLT